MVSFSRFRIGVLPRSTGVNAHLPNGGLSAIAISRQAVDAIPLADATAIDRYAVCCRRAFGALAVRSGREDFAARASVRWNADLDAG